MTNKYELTFINNSGKAGDVCIFLRYPDEKESKYKSLAWLTKKSNPDVTNTFTWDRNPCFIWSDTEVLNKETTITSSQSVKAGIKENNIITFTKNEGAYEFKDRQTGDIKNKKEDRALEIKCDDTIPQALASIGIGMSNIAAVVTDAKPNTSFIFYASNDFNIAFGKFTQGEVIDASSVENVAHFNFPTNVYKIKATLNPDNKWSFEIDS